MKHTLLSLTTITLLTTGLSAGGKIVAPVEAEVIPIVAPAVATASATPFYLGVGLIAAMIERDPCPCTPDAPNLEDTRYGSIVRAGWDFNAYIGVEARALKTFGSDNFSTTEHYGIYLKPQIHVAEQVNLYALAGYGKTNIDYTNGLKSSSFSKSGFSYGAGLEYDLSEESSHETYDRAFDGQGDQEAGWGLWLDFQHLLDAEGRTHTDSNLITAGLTYDF